jgi:hypothetical protein
MKTQTERILTVMNILTWVVFIGLMIQAGSILVSYGVSIINPAASKNLYKGLDLSSLKQFNFWHYTLIVSFMVAMAIVKSYAAYLVIKVLSEIKMVNPFTMEVARMLEKISYFIFGAWIITLFYDLHVAWLMKRVVGMQENYVSGEFIFLAGLVFVIAQIFKKGVEIQSENDLTV